MTQGMSDGPTQRRLQQAAQSVFEQVADAVLIVTADGVIRAANPAAASIFGLSAPDMTARDIRSLIPAWEALTLSAPASGRIDVTVRRAGGASVAVQLSLRAIQLDEDPGFVAVVTDRTEIQALEARLHDAQRLASIGLLAGGVAHDFHNLLMIVAGNCERLRSQAEWPDAARTSLDQIVVATEHATALAAQLLALSRPATAAAGVIDLHAALLETARLLQGSLSDNVTIEMRLGREPRHVRMNPSDVGQILINLAINARDAMPAGGRLSIQTRTLTLDPAAGAGHLAPGDYVELTISDTGAGMSEEARARAFEPFFTTKATEGGTGLGLTNVARIVRAHGGEIRLETAPGGGAAFVMLLPVCEPEGTDYAAAGPSQALPTGSETALVVEDDSAVRDIVATMLRDLGYRTKEASGLSEALAAVEAEAGRVDLLVSDMVMPDINGLDMADRLRREVPTLKVLFMSGFTDDDALAHRADRADQAFIRKPFSRAVLARCVRDLLDSADSGAPAS
jgi:PAS domain S-box-containing protein